MSTAFLAPPSSSHDPAGGLLVTGVPDMYSVADSSADEGELRATTDLEPPHVNFNQMLAYVTQCFPEAKGHKASVNRPEPPGANKPVDDNRGIRLTRAKPMQFSLDAAAKALLHANETSRPSLARYPSARFRRVYTVSGHESAGQAAKLNPDLALALTTRGKEPQVVVPSADMTRLEGVLARSREAQNFTFWCMGAFYRLLSSLHPGLEDRMLADQLFKSIQMAMVDMAKDSAFALANVRAMRREAVLSHLPPTYKTASKVDLRQSTIDSSLLFEESKVKEALSMADKAASISFQQAAARALVKQRPAPGTPLVARGSRASSSGAFPQRSSSFRRPEPTSQQRTAQRQKPRSFPSSSSSSSRNPTKFFRK